jgi:hypothetical protein
MGRRWPCIYCLHRRSAADDRALRAAGRHFANNPDTKLYKFTRVDDQVVLVDPTKMRVIAVIGAKPKE